MGIENVLPVEVEEERKLVWTEVAILMALVGLPVWVSDYFGTNYRSISLLEDNWLRIAQALPLCALAIYLMVRSGRGWAHFGLGKNWDFTGFLTFFLGLVAVGMFLVWLSATIHQAISGKPPIDGQPYGPVPHTIWEWLSFWPVLLLGAAMEELVFRGFATARIYDVTGKKWLAVVLPSILFGSMHFYQGIVSAVSIGVYGALFGVMFLEWRKLKALILAHFAFNVWAFSSYLQ